MLRFLDYFFLIFHSSLIIFNLFGWAWRKTRKLNLISLLLTGGSWLILGFWFGFGYCPLTDFHWKVLERLGKTDLPGSYIQYLFRRILSIEISPSLSDILALGGLLVSFVISCILNYRSRRLK